MPDVADETRLTADDDPLPQLRAARDADLGDDDGILPDHHVVGDLDEVVDLHPPLDPGPAEGAAVDGRVRADLHIVVDLDVADLGDLEVFLARQGKAEAVAPDDDAGMEDDPPADQAAAVDGDAGIEDGGLADGGIPADEDPRVEHRLSLDARPAADVDAGIDHGLRRDVGPRLDGCIFADPRGLFLLGMEKGKQPAQGDVRVRDDQEVFPRACRSRGDEDCARTGGFELFPVFRVGHEGEIPFAGLVDPPDPFDHDPAVAADAAAQKRGDLVQCLFTGLFIPCYFLGLYVLLNSSITRFVRSFSFA